MGAGSRQRRVCVVGSINMDLVVRAPRFPAAGETILGGEFATFPGGKGANQAVAAARMGARVSMIGRVGDDAYGVELRRVLEAEGIDTVAVLTTRDTPTGVAVITVAEGGGNTIVVAPGANGKVTPADVETAREKIEGADVVLMQLEVPVEAVTRSAEIARGAGVVVMLNAAPARHVPLALLQVLDVLVMNETEARLVSDSYWSNEGATVDVPGRFVDPSSPEACVARVEGMPLREAVITMGDKGAWKIGRGRATRYDPYQVDAVDSVGAGDAFCGALAAKWARVTERDTQLEILDAIYAASAAGALACTRRGAIPSLPRRDEVNALITRHQGQVEANWLHPKT